MYIPSDSEVADRVVLKRKDASNIPGWDELALYDKVRSSALLAILLGYVRHFRCWSMLRAPPIGCQ